MTKITRRDFLKQSTYAGLALSAPLILGAQQDKVYRTALIGSGWWGMNIATEALDAGQSNFVALCDVDENQLNPAVERIEKMSGQRPKKYMDYRELLAQEKPDLVINATPDHWHALITIDACKAGADVFVEKPIGHTIQEGRAMVNAARDNDRIVQVDTHRRVSPHNMSAIQFLQDGKAGEIGMVRAFVHYGGGPGEPTPNEEPPEGLDWDMWCGPAPYRPFNPRIHPRGFRQFLDYANGQVADWGIHWLDQILWWTEEKYPKSVHSTGGRHIKQDNTTAPDTQIVSYEFESFTATWEHRLYGGNRAENHNIGLYFYGTRGMMHIGWLDGWTFYPSDSDQPTIHEDPVLHQPDNQNIPELWNDFLRSVRTRELPVCDIEVGHLSTNMSLLGMLSYKLGRSVEWDGEKEIIPGDDEANALLRREYRDPWEYPSV